MYSISLWLSIQPLKNTYEPAVSLAASPPLKPTSRQNGRNCASSNVDLQISVASSNYFNLAYVSSQYPWVCSRVESGVGLNTNSAIHVVVLIADYFQRFYVDAIPGGDGTPGPDSHRGDDPFNSSFFSPASLLYLSDSIYDIAVYDTLLSPAQIEILFNTPISSPPATLVPVNFTVDAGVPSTLNHKDHIPDPKCELHFSR